jgi:hypothetical protein
MTHTIEPTSLVMRYNRCFYCQADSTGDYGESHIFGIRHCAAHAAAARRDYGTFLHKIDKVALHDAYNNPQLRPLLIFLEMTDMNIRRTNGMIENNWRLRRPNYADFVRICKIGKDWCVPMIHNSHITKNVPLVHFLEATILAANANILPDNFAQMVRDALMVLEAGIYHSFYMEAASLNPSSPIKETCGVIIYDRVVGKVRVFEPSLAV